MSETDRAAVRPEDTQERDQGAEESSSPSPQAREAAPSGQPGLAGLDEATQQILREDTEAELTRAATPEIGTTTDPASNEPRRGEP